jgi:hypothetical protein
MNLHIHEWSLWSEVFNQQVEPATSRKQQAKTCKKCGIIKLRFVGLSTYTASDLINKALSTILMFKEKFT